MKKTEALKIKMFCENQTSEKCFAEECEIVKFCDKLDFPPIQWCGDWDKNESWEHIKFPKELLK
jgi:hypothetical protein